MAAYDKAQAFRFKREQLRLLRGGRGECSDDIKQPSKCADCDGTGVYTGILKSYECGSCKGCGFDLSDPLAVVQWQASQLKIARSFYAKLKKDYYHLKQRYGVKRFNDENLEAAMRGKDGKGRLD